MSEKQEQMENAATESAVNAEADTPAGNGGESMNDDNIAGLEKKLEEAFEFARPRPKDRRERNPDQSTAHLE